MDSAAWLLTLLRNHSLHKCRHGLADNIDHEDYDGRERGALNEHLRVKVADEQRQRHVRDVCEENATALIVTMQLTNKYEAISTTVSAVRGKNTSSTMRLPGCRVSGSWPRGCR